MEMVVRFPGGSKVDAHFGDYVVRTDQPSASGGDGSAPTPFAMFLASLATCAGIYVVGFCRQRGIPTENIEIVQNAEKDPATGMVSKVSLDIRVPPEFPEHYYTALVRVAEQCTVKKHLENPPTFVVRTVSNRAR